MTTRTDAAVGGSRALFAEMSETIARLGPWRAGGLAFALGAAGTFAQAPFHVWPALVLAMTGFVWLLDGAAEQRTRMRAGFWRGFCFGFGQFLGGLWWIANAFAERGPEFAPLAIPGVLALTMGLGLFWGAGGAIAARMWRHDTRRIALMAVVFSLVEFARGHVLTGLPWNLPGYIWVAGQPVSQSAAFIGVYGLSALTLYICAAPAALGGPDKGVARVAPLVAAFVILAVLYAGGLGRLARAQDETVDGVALRIVQAQISQREKWDPANRDMVIDRYLHLTGLPGLEDRTHVVWPESALPLLFLEEPRALDAAARVVGDGRVLLTGTVRRDAVDPLNPTYYNSLVSIPINGGKPDLGAAAFYDKVHLVPFGEYLPLSRQLKKLGLETFANLASSFEAGPARAPMKAPGAPEFSPQICYEIIFPGFTTRGPDRPDWILNVSNDAWYGNTAGPRQHFNQVRFRSIEEGLAVVRAASGGVSAVVDPYGRTVARLPMNAEDVLDAPLPVPLPPTVYAMVGEAGFVILMFIGVVATFSPPPLTRKDS